MKPLIEIKSVPISIEYKVNAARFERTSGQANIEISRSKGGLTIKSEPIRLNIDTFEARNSVMPTTMRANVDNANLGKKAAYEATARMAEEGQLLVQIHIDRDAIGEMSANRSRSNTKEFGLGFTPKAPPEINWSDTDIMIRYEMDKLSFDLKNISGDYEFIPGDIEFKVLEYNKVLIEYIGDPIYVPPSSDPNYTPVDVRV